MRYHVPMGTYPTEDVVRQARAPKDAPCARKDAPQDAPQGAPCAALIVGVEPGSPADDAGFAPGCRLTSVDGQTLRDIIDWRWLSADDVIEVGYIDLDGDCGTVVLERDEGQDWGFEFDGLIFDAVKLCRNACTFCFMRQLPEGMRGSLSLRDDDFRLSFLAGTFVTLTNLTSDDEQRIIEQRISPLRVSLHASDPQVRRRMIGRHAAHGLTALERLLEAGVRVHAQIVLVPGDNDGRVLTDTLSWAYAHPGIEGVGIVPLGFTKHQTCFHQSFTTPAAARAVIRAIEPFQSQALCERGTPWVFAADEFYVNGFREDLLKNLPPTSHYGDFSMFEDGIGIVRSFVDDWHMAEESGIAARCAAALRARGIVARYVVGEAMQPFLDQLVAASPVAGVFEPLTVRNCYFGGNVNVTGLLCGCDVAAAVRQAEGGLFALPRVMFNDDLVTLDDMTVQEMETAAGKPLAVVSCSASEYLQEIAGLI